MHISKLEHISKNVEERMSQQYCEKKRYEITENVFFYIVEPGDHTRYQIMIAPLSKEMCMSLNLGQSESTYHMVTLIIGDTMKSFPVDLRNVWNPGYLKQKFRITDNYTHTMLYKLLSYIGDELATEQLFMASSVYDGE